MRCGYKPTPLMDRFWPKVNKTESCWIWTANKISGGYGRISTRRCAYEFAHRISWMVHFGDPGKLHVLHRCDNRACVRPDHLFLGTCFDNMQDCSAKGRIAFGERNAHTKLSNAEAFEIKKLLVSGTPQRHIAKQFGVCRSLIASIAVGKVHRRT